MIYLFIGLFVLFTGTSLYNNVITILPEKWFTSQILVPYFKQTPVVAIVVLLLSLGLSTFWAVQRKHAYGWIIQNVLSVSFLVSATSSLKVPNLKLITIFLAALLVYDVFFVFITPFLTKDGSSIMVRAAMGKPGDDGCYNEGLPFLIRIPRAPVECECPSDMALGYGDVVLPSLLVAFAMRWDYYLIWASDRSATEHIGTAFEAPQGIPLHCM